MQNNHEMKQNNHKQMDTCWFFFFYLPYRYNPRAPWSQPLYEVTCCGINQMTTKRRKTTTRRRNKRPWRRKMTKKTHKTSTEMQNYDAKQRWGGAREPQIVEKCGQRDVKSPQSDAKWPWRDAKRSLKVAIWPQKDGQLAFYLPTGPGLLDQNCCKWLVVELIKWPQRGAKQPWRGAKEWQRDAKRQPNGANGLHKVERWPWRNVERPQGDTKQPQMSAGTHFLITCQWL